MMTPDANVIGPIINLGAVGCCLVVLAIYYMKKDRKYETRIDERLARELAHQKEMSDLNEKYRLAMENVTKSLDSVIRVLPRRDGGA